MISKKTIEFIGKLLTVVGTLLASYFGAAAQGMIN